MTILGKILVFLILALALAQAAFHVMFHVTQTNWKEGYAKLDQVYKVTEARAETWFLICANTSFAAGITTSPPPRSAPRSARRRRRPRSPPRAPRRARSGGRSTTPGRAGRSASARR